MVKKSKDISKGKRVTHLKKVESQKKKTILPINQVHLIGRVSSIMGSKKLPSGDLVSEFRIVVDRSSHRGSIDTIDIAVWQAKLRNQIERLLVDEWVEIHGSVRRRFWQSATGLASRWQVEANKVIRLK